MSQKFANTATTTLYALIDEAATSIQVSSTSAFPVITSGQYFMCTLFTGSRGSEADVEIVKVTGVSGTNWTIVRAQEGTTAQDYSALAQPVTVDLRPTAATFARFLQDEDNLSNLTNLTDARSNLGLGTAAVVDVPATGNAATDEVVLGNDTRLTDSRAPTSHSTSSHSDWPATVSMTEVGYLDGVTSSIQTQLNGKQPSGSYEPANANIQIHIASISNPHGVTKAQVGLTNAEDKTFAVGVADATHAATSKTAPVDADEIPLADSADSWGIKKLTWSNLKTTLATWLETLTATWSNKTLTSPTVSGNLTFSGTGNRITGDFSNATHANRVAFQTSTVNGATSLHTLPNGTSQVAQANFYSSTDPDNASMGQFVMVGGEAVRLVSGKTGTGTYLPMTFYTGGDKRVTIDTSGNVGIGTTPDPTCRQEIYSTGANPLKITTNISGNDNCQLRFKSVSGERWAIGNNVATGGTGVNFDIYDLVSGANRLRIDSSGNVTASAAGTYVSAKEFRIDAQSYLRTGVDMTSGAGWGGGYNTYYSSGWKHANVGAATAITHNSDGSVRVFTDASQAVNTAQTERMRIDSSGNVGIGRAPAAKKFEVAGQTFVQDATHPATYWGNNFNDYLGAYYTPSTKEGVIAFDGTGTTFAIKNNGANRLVIDSSGNVGIGTPPAAGYKLHTLGGNLLLQSTVPCIRFASAGAVNNWYVGTNISDVFNGGFQIGRGVGIGSSTPDVVIDSSGVVTCNNGIKPSTSSDTLSVYDEGTWTPTVTGITGITSSAYAYTKIGRQVFVNIVLIGTGTLTIANGATISTPFTQSMSTIGRAISPNTGGAADVPVWNNQAVFYGGITVPGGGGVYLSYNYFA